MTVGPLTQISPSSFGPSTVPSSTLITYEHNVDTIVTYHREIDVIYVNFREVRKHFE